MTEQRRKSASATLLALMPLLLLGSDRFSAPLPEVTPVPPRPPPIPPSIPDENQPIPSPFSVDEYQMRDGGDMFRRFRLPERIVSVEMQAKLDRRAARAAKQQAGLAKKVVK